MALRRSSLLPLSRALLLRNTNKPFLANPLFQDSSLETLTSTIPQLQINPTFSSQSKPFSSSSYFTISHHNFFFSPSRSFCSSSEPSPSNFVVVKSEEEFNTSLNKAQGGDSLPAIFYFTASWCGPCKLISPIIQELSKKYPNVTTYKIDVDQNELQSTLQNLKIYSVPTLHFFKDGKKANEMVGADVSFLKQTMENLYK